MVGLVVDGAHVEGLEEVHEFLGAGGLQRGAQVGDGRKQGFDFGWSGAVGASRFKRLDGCLGGGAAGAEFLDAPGGEGDDGVVGIVVLFEAEALAVERAVGVLEFEAQPGELGVVLAPALGDRAGELVAQEAEPLGPEEAAAHELDQLVEDDLLFDLQRTRMAGDVGGDVAAVGLEAAAVPVGVLLVAAFHAPAAQRAADAAAEHVETSVAPS